MALSDEDYGILYNAVEAGMLCWEVPKIIYTYTTFEEWIKQIKTVQWMLDFAAFIILSEGRELP